MHKKFLFENVREIVLRNKIIDYLERNGASFYSTLRREFSVYKKDEIREVIENGGIFEKSTADDAIVIYKSNDVSEAIIDLRIYLKSYERNPDALITFDTSKTPNIDVLCGIIISRGMFSELICWSCSDKYQFYSRIKNEEPIVVKLKDSTMKNKLDFLLESKNALAPSLYKVCSFCNTCNPMLN